MKKYTINNKLAFYSGLIYLTIMTLFVIIKVLSYFGLLDFYGSDYIFKILVQIGFMFLLPLFLYSKIFKTNLKQTFYHFGFRKTSKKSIWVSVILGICMFVLINYFSSLWVALLNLFGFKFFSSGAGDYSVLSFFLNILFVGILPAVCEETTHRGLVLNGIKKNGNIRAIVLTGLLFGFMHFNILQFGYASLVGMLLCFVTLLSRSIYPAMIMHFVNNFLSVFLSFSLNSNWLKNSIVDYFISFEENSNPILLTIMKFLVVLIAFYVLFWGIAKLFVEGKKKSYTEFKYNLKKEIEGTDLEKDINVDDDKQVSELFREVHLINLEKQLKDKKITIHDIIGNSTKKSTEMMLSEKLEAPEKKKYSDYIFFYIALFLGSLGTIATLVLGFI
ncbi:MAG: CPBP family intramembrane metalloprotease [Clostridia bacterium]|nr:CPBP family intramembrane metalloprotease [Clostridia bacterium]